MLVALFAAVVLLSGCPSASTPTTPPTPDDAQFHAAVVVAT